MLNQNDYTLVLNGEKITNDSLLYFPQFNIFFKCPKLCVLSLPIYRATGNQNVN